MQLHIINKNTCITEAAILAYFILKVTICAATHFHILNTLKPADSKYLEVFTKDSDVRVANPANYAIII